MSDLGNREIMAKNIKYYMVLNGKSRRQVCKDLGFAYSTFSDWVNGKKYPRIDKIEMMANYFNIEKSDLVENKKQIYENDQKSLSNLNKEIPQEFSSCLNIGGITIYQIPIYTQNLYENNFFKKENVADKLTINDIGFDFKANYFATYSPDDLMEKAGIFKDDILVFEKKDDIEAGKIGCFYNGHDMPICRMIFKPNDNVSLIQTLSEDFMKDISSAIYLQKDKYFCIGELKTVIKKVNLKNKKRKEE